uniref:glycosyltransferase family 2 protein n=1 Tax=Bifidobacterium moukalabense TaxID=1333651 RepID=UPI001485C08B
MSEYKPSALITNLPLISIIIPVYNVIDYLDQAIESVLIQTYQNLEILIIDDGSTDGSAERCDYWDKLDSRIYVFHKRNGGLSDARNYGLERCHGEYIAFLDSDDCYSNWAIERLYEICLENKADIAISDPVHWYGEQDPQYVYEKDVKIYSSSEAIAEMLYQRSFLVSAWGKLFRRNCFKTLRFPKSILFEDSAVMYKIFEAAGLIAYTPSKSYAYRHHSGSITTSDFKDSDLDILFICEEIENHYKDDVKILPAAIAYRANACLRIILNAPNGKYIGYITECNKYITAHIKQLLRDK